MTGLGRIGLDLAPDPVGEHPKIVLTCAGFVVLMGAQAFIFGNAGALAALKATHIAGAAAALQGVAIAVAMAVAAPLASAGGGETAVAMVAVMAVGATLAIGSRWFAGRAGRPTT